MDCITERLGLCSIFWSLLPNAYTSLGKHKNGICIHGHISHPYDYEHVTYIVFDSSREAFDSCHNSPQWEFQFFFSDFISHLDARNMFT